jgi:SnoaL-like domain
MLYSYIVRTRIRQTFDHVNNHRWDEVLKPVAPNVHHRFAGAHSLGGERHDKETLRRWFERLGRVQPNVHLKVNNIWVKGWAVAYHRVCAVGRYRNAAQRRRFVLLHVFTLRWGKVYALDMFEDTQEVARGLAAQAAAGLEEAVAEQIVS